MPELRDGWLAFWQEISAQQGWVRWLGFILAFTVVNIVGSIIQRLLWGPK